LVRAERRRVITCHRLTDVALMRPLLRDPDRSLLETAGAPRPARHGVVMTPRYARGGSAKTTGGPGVTTKPSRSVLVVLECRPRHDGRGGRGRSGHRSITSAVNDRIRIVRMQDFLTKLVFDRRDIDEHSSGIVLEPCSLGVFYDASVSSALPTSTNSPS